MKARYILFTIMHALFCAVVPIVFIFIQYGDTSGGLQYKLPLAAILVVELLLILAVLAIGPAQDLANIAAWAMFCMRLLTIVWTAYSSEHEGYTRITETKNKVVLRRIAFLHEFEEWGKIHKPQPDVTLDCDHQS